MRYDYQTATRLAKTHECATCRETSVLTVRWHENAWDLWCSRCKNTGDFREQESLTRRWRRNPGSVPVSLANRLEQRYGGRPMQDLALTPANQQALAQRITGCAWASGMSPAQRETLAHAGIAYKLDPLMGELIWYEGAPLITVAGHLRIANRDPAWEDLELRPMTGPERADYGIQQPVAWIAKVWKRGKRSPAIGIGAADPVRPHRSKWDSTRKEMVGGNPIERDEPWRMARARALKMALRTYFPHSLPIRSELDLGDADVPPEPALVNPASSEPADGQPVGAPAGSTEPLSGPDADETQAGVDDSGAEAARARIINLLAELGRTPDEPLLQYFALREGVSWTDAPAAVLDRFGHHLGDLIAKLREKGGKV